MWVSQKTLPPFRVIGAQANKSYRLSVKMSCIYIWVYTWLLLLGSKILCSINGRWSAYDYTKVRICSIFDSLINTMMAFIQILVGLLSISSAFPTSQRMYCLLLFEVVIRMKSYISKQQSSREGRQRSMKWLGDSSKASACAHYMLTMPPMGTKFWTTCGARIRRRLVLNVPIMMGQ